MIERSFIAAPEHALEAPDIRRLLAQEAGRLLADAGHTVARRIVQVVLPVESVDPFRWLQAQPFDAKVYWSGRGSDTQFAAAGVADMIAVPGPRPLDGVEAVLERLQGAAEGVRYFGGARFDESVRPDADWKSFGSYCFVLPRFVLKVQDGQATLACNLVLPQDQHRRAELQAEIRAVEHPVEPLTGALPLPVSRTDWPDRSGWIRNVDAVLESFEDGPMEKVVLARKVAFGFNETLDPAMLLKQLKAATPACHHFYFQASSGSAFLGASPERLYLREGRAVVTEAVAGTGLRGISTQDDERLRDELLHSDKDRREHLYVQQCIAEVLSAYCDEVRADAHTSEMTLALGRHLYSAYSGTLRSGVTDADLLRALHPTPAVGGYPRKEAMEAIHDLEPFDRGWYAGPIGWIGRDEAEFAVAIRSGLVEGKQLALFSGAGIVPGSEPEREHAEVEQKISDFVRVLGLDNGRA